MLNSQLADQVRCQLHSGIQLMENRGMVLDTMLTKVRQSNSVSAASVFALLLSVISLCASVFIGYWVVKPKTIPFTPMENL